MLFSPVLSLFVKDWKTTGVIKQWRENEKWDDSLSFGGLCVYAQFLFHISDLSKISLTTSPFLFFGLLGFANSKGYVFGILER